MDTTPQSESGAGSDRRKHRDLIAFHTAHKFTLLAHSPALYRQLGRIVGNGERRPFADVMSEYAKTLQAALATMPTRAKHVNVLQHALGHLRGVAPAEVRRAVAASIAAYEAGRVPLAVPMRQISEYAQQYQIEYLACQTYFRAAGRNDFLGIGAP